MSSLSAIILAAGEGKRMKSEKPKVLHKICSKPLVRWVYDAAKEAGALKCVLVVGHKAEQVMEYMGQGVDYAVQESQLGTGHAVMQAMPYIGNSGEVFVLAGDVPLIKGSTLKAALEMHRGGGYAVTVITAEIENPYGYGRIIRSEDGGLDKIVEEKDASDSQREIKEVNSGLLCFNAGLLKQALSQLKNDNAQGEYYLTDTVEILIKSGHKAGAFKVEDSSEIFGVNDRAQLAAAGRIMRGRILNRLMLEGVTIIDPAATYIGADVKIGRDTVVYPGCILEGNTDIGENCTIGPYSRLDNVKVGSGTEVANTVARDSSIGQDCRVGPFAYIRPGSVIGNNIKIGDFVEVKNSVIGDGTKVSHLTYIGDSDVGKDINFGCGTVTVNYDGKEKHRTTIKDGAFIGCNTNLVAPVTVNEGAYIAAGSTITDDVPQGSLAIARAKQVIKQGWKLRRMGEGK